MKASAYYELAIDSDFTFGALDPPRSTFLSYNPDTYPSFESDVSGEIPNTGTGTIGFWFIQGSFTTVTVNICQPGSATCGTFAQFSLSDDTLNTHVLTF